MGLQREPEPCKASKYVFIELDESKIVKNTSTQRNHRYHAHKVCMCVSTYTHTHKHTSVQTSRLRGDSEHIVCVFREETYFVRRRCAVKGKQSNSVLSMKRELIKRVINSKIASSR